MTGCYQCSSLMSGDGESALAWDLGEIYGLSDPTRLPSPTTNSCSRTVVLLPKTCSAVHLDIRDAERVQGLQPGYTVAPTAGVRAALSCRWQCVGNALPGCILVEIMKRLNNQPLYRSAILQDDRKVADDSLQPKPQSVPPAAAYPAHGTLRRNILYCIENCSDNMVNVRLFFTQANIRCSFKRSVYRALRQTLFIPVQVPRQPLEDFLQFSYDPVTYQELDRWSERFKKHEKRAYDEAQQFLQQHSRDDWPACCRQRGEINPAILALLRHRNELAENRGRQGKNKVVCVPATNRTASHADCDVEVDREDIGEVCWVLCKGELYLAEVWRAGSRPNNRLPFHTFISEKHTVRKLGVGRCEVKVVPASTQLCEFSVLYVPFATLLKMQCLSCVLTV